MVGGDDDGCRDKDLPFAIEGKESERSKDVEMRFDSPAGQVNQQSRPEDLRDGDDVSRNRTTRHHQGQKNRQAADRPAEKNGSPDMRMNVAFGAGPGSGRNEDGGDDPEDPL